MGKQHRLTMGPGLGFAIAKNTHTLGTQAVAGLHNILHLETDVVNAALGITHQELSHRGILAQRRHKLDGGVGKLHENHAHPVIGIVLNSRNLCPQNIALHDPRHVNIGNHNSHVVEFANH